MNSRFFFLWFYFGIFFFFDAVICVSGVDFEFSRLVIRTCDLLRFHLLLVWMARKQRERSILSWLVDWSVLFSREKFRDSEFEFVSLFSGIFSATKHWIGLIFVHVFFLLFFLSESFYGLRDDDIIVFGFMC